MEKRTIGGLIAVLRKANGMTQRELAERLNVSDKTVSRWERDDGAPDLSAIPVIAEIFGVTCDELLRGERRSPSARLESKSDAVNTETSAKAEKQRKHLLAVSFSKYKTHTFISMGIAAVGLIAAMIGNFGFLRAYIGFFAGLVFYLAAGVAQVIFVNSAMLSVSEENQVGSDEGKFRRAVIRLAESAFGEFAAVLGFSLPLIIFPADTYMGLTAGSWFLYGILFAGAAVLLVGVVCYFLNAVFLNKGVYTLQEQEEERYWYLHRKKGMCALILTGIMVTTAVVHIAVTELWGPWSVMEGIKFYDYESFVAYMEQDIPYQYKSVDGMAMAEEVESEDVRYYDEFGNEISEEEALRKELRIADGSENGKVICEYIARNQMVCSIRYTQTEDSLLPITVCTYDDLTAAKETVAVRNRIFIGVYCLETAGGIVMYAVIRKKYTEKKDRRSDK